MRQQVLTDVQQLQSLLEHHRNRGLPEADLQVIRRGKALQYFSRHYGKVYVDEDRKMEVKEALWGINQLLHEELNTVTDLPPANAEPFTRQFLQLFHGKWEVPQDQMQKYLRGTGMTPGDFEKQGWCRIERKKKVYHLISPLEIARQWVGESLQSMRRDYDQATFLIGACFEKSGINVMDTLHRTPFKPHPALEALLDWFFQEGANEEIRKASKRASNILKRWRTMRSKEDQKSSSLLKEPTKKETSL